MCNKTYNTELKFGFLKDCINIENSEFSIRQISKDIPQYINEAIKKENGWIYAENIKNRLFTLPSNYILESNNISEQHGRFIIQCLSFFKNVRLASLPNEFIDATNVKTNQLGFLLTNKDIEEALLCASSFWSQHDDDKRTNVYNIIHLLFLSINRKTYFQFERFAYLNMMLDACLNCFPKNENEKKGDNKIKRLSIRTGVHFPLNDKMIVDLRNDLFHEGLFNKGALGYHTITQSELVNPENELPPNYDPLLCISDFISQILFRIFEISVTGFENFYNSRQTHLITIINGIKKNKMSNLPKCYGVIPSRYKSTRLPGKPLADIHGKPMFWHVYQRAAACPYFEKVVIATESELIMEAAAKYDIPCIMTGDHHQSGTDRVLEAAQIMGVPDDAVVANIQGDEPAIHPEMMNELLTPFADDAVQVSTLAHVLSKEDAQNPNHVKVALTHDQTALYFSRSPIPYDRNGIDPVYYNHIGLYAFRMPVLRQFPTLPESPLEKAESLEQLRLMQAKIPIHVGITRHKNASVDVPADLEIVKKLINPAGMV